MVAIGFAPSNWHTEMSVIAEFSVPAEEFPLGELLEVREGVQVRLETMIPTGELLLPYFWVGTGDTDAIKAALRRSPLVESVKVLDQVGEETLFRVRWTEDVDGVIQALVGTDCVLLDGTGHGDHWSFQLRFAEAEELSRFYQDVLDAGIPISLDSLHNPVENGQFRGPTLTEEQREALTLALAEGYFAVPRRITLVELAERLGVSDSAASQRIRRGLNNLLSDRLE